MLVGWHASERYRVITLLIGTSMIAGIGLGWYGYKASLRIAEWGRGMDECDQIFQTATEGIGSTNFEDVRKRIPKDGPRIAPFVTSQLRP
jgi:hypothetical protein